MRSSMLVKGGALLAAAAVIGLSAAPAEAASHVSQASATAASVKIAGQGTSTDTYTAINDGNGQSTTGSNRPLISALGGQSLISAGTLAQDAVATVDGQTGASAACSGLAGQGATVVAAGDGTCLSGGDTLSLDVANLDLSRLKVLSSPLFAGLDDQLETALKPLQDQLTSALTTGFTQAVDALGDPSLHLDMGAVQSYCTAAGTQAAGDSQLAGAGAYVEIPTGDGNTQRVDLVALPVHPGPNTHVVTGLDKVADSIESALRTQLTTLLSNPTNSPLDALTGQLNVGLGGLLNQLDPVLDNLLGEISSQLAPLEQNLLDITLNEQTRGSGSISVTALDVKVAPAARQFTGSDLADLTVGTSNCGPNGRVITTSVHKATPAKPQTTTPHSTPKKVPTVVTAGMADAPDDHGSAGRTALVVLLILGAGGVGISVFRRVLQR